MLSSFVRPPKSIKIPRRKPPLYHLHSSRSPRKHSESPGTVLSTPDLDLYQDDTFSQAKYINNKHSPVLNLSL